MALFYTESTRRFILSFSRHLHAALDSSTEPVNIVISPLSGSMVLACYVDSLSLWDVLFVLATSHCTQSTMGLTMQSLQNRQN